MPTFQINVYVSNRCLRFQCPPSWEEHRHAAILRTQPRQRLESPESNWQWKKVLFLKQLIYNWAHWYWSRSKSISCSASRFWNDRWIYTESKKLVFFRASSGVLWQSLVFTEPKQLVFFWASFRFFFAAAVSKKSALVNTALLVVNLLLIFRCPRCCPSRTATRCTSKTIEVGRRVLLCAVRVEAADVEGGRAWAAQRLLSLRWAALPVRVVVVPAVVPRWPAEL